MVKATNDIHRETFIEEIFSLVKSKVMGSIFGKTEVTIKELSLMVYVKATEFGTVKLEIHTKDNIKMERKMAMGYTSGLMELFIKVISKKIFVKDTVKCCGKMVVVIREVGGRMLKMGLDKFSQKV